MCKYSKVSSAAASPAPAEIDLTNIALADAYNRFPRARRDRPLFDEDAWITIQRAHAVANGIPVLSCNRVGFEPDPSEQTSGSLFWGSSFAAGPQGEILASAPTDQACVLLVELDMARSEQVRRIWPHLRDRRIDAYAGLVKRYLD